jgi:hypothetical protein
MLKNYINRKWNFSDSHELLDILNPANGQFLARVLSECKDDIADAAEKAHRSRPWWRNTPAIQRVEGEFYGDNHGQSLHAIEFYTQTKVVIERWNEEWIRKF